MTTQSGDGYVAKIRAWLAGRLPADWFTGAADVTIDREEITIVGPLAAPDIGEGATEAEVASAAQGRAREFRERTREARIGIARELEHRTGRKVSWGVTVGDSTSMFTTASVPVMTRLRQPERQVLDTLVAAGVARSRSEALAWCVRLVGRHSEDWLAQLRGALGRVDEVRQAGPQA
jgi:hypothetical protein